MEQHLIEQLNAMGWKQLGVGAIFVALEVITIIYFYKHIQSQSKEQLSMIEKVQTALTTSTKAVESAQKSNEEVCEVVESLNRAQTEFIAYLRGRDSK